MIYLFKTLAQKATITSLTPATTIGRSIYAAQTAHGKLNIRNFSFPELELLRTGWLAKEGWSFPKHSMPAIYSLDPAGFYCLENNGEKVAALSLVTYPESGLAYAGMYVVPEQLRSKGYGGIIFNETINFSIASRGVTTVGLNCYESMSPLYMKWGFKTATVDYIWKFVFKASMQQELEPEVILESIDDSLLQDLIKFDAAVFGASRTDFLTKYTQKPETTTAIFKNGDSVEGYGVISARLPIKQEAQASYRVGPLYANSPEIAGALLDNLLAAIDLKPNDCVFLETPGNNATAAPIVTRFEFEKVASMNKMYKGPEPKFDTNRMFCYCSLATGG